MGVNRLRSLDISFYRGFSLMVSWRTGTIPWSNLYLRCQNADVLVIGDEDDLYWAYPHESIKEITFDVFSISNNKLLYNNIK